MTAAQIKQAWHVWQEANQDEATRLRHRFATKAIEHGFQQAERYLITAIAERLDVSWAEVAKAMASPPRAVPRRPHP